MSQTPSFSDPRVAAALALVAVLGLPSSAIAQTEPHLGTWNLNTAKSVYTPGPPPRGQVRTYSRQGDGLTAVIETIQPLGLKTTARYTAMFDGKDNPLTGNADADTIALTRIDPWTFEATLKKSGKVVNSVRNTVSRDGKTMTVVAKGTNAQGKPTSSEAVFVKQ